MEREKLIQEIVLEAHKQGIVTNAELATFRDGVTVGIEAGAASVDRVEIVREAFELLEFACSICDETIQEAKDGD